VSQWTEGEGVAFSQLCVTIGLQARQKVGPLDCHAAIILKLKEWFPDTQRYVKVRALKNWLSKNHTQPGSPTIAYKARGYAQQTEVIRQDSSC